ncbi:MAG: C25 family cysteine peptidase [Bacteroidales bacterium]|nr:C25 family cysteine peptidase [Bacteroidales bacterium]
MKKIVYTFAMLLLILANLTLEAQNIIGQNNNNIVNNPPFIKESMEDLSFSQKFDFLRLDTEQTDNGVFFRLYMGEDFGRTQKVGIPELPTYNKLIEIPYGAEIQIEYKNVVTESISLDKYGKYKVIPSQKSLSKSKDFEPFIIDDKVYSINAFVGNDLVRVEQLGFMSSIRLARLVISPIKYNPGKNVIEIVRSFDVTIKFVNADIKSTINAKRIYNNQQSSFLKSSVLNGKNLSATVSDSPLNRPLKMIILSDPMFEETLQPFIRWKREKGIEIVEVYKGDAGVGTTNSSIKAYLKSLWDNASADAPAADYLLICGDSQQIPPFAAVTKPEDPAPTDLYYAEYTGDFLPDLFYGRFSAQTVQQMENIINKVVNYEQFLFQDTVFLKKTLLVAGKETSAPAPTCGNGQVNYAKQYLQNNPSIDTLIYYNPSSGSYSSQIRDSISQKGFSYINYTAHCDEMGWSSPSLSATNINSMTNYGKFPMFINNCCLSNKFDVNECFGEAVLRANNKGGIGAIGGSNYTYWYEDFYWSVGSKSLSLNPSYDSNNLGAYDRLFHKYNEPFNKWYITSGQIMQGGNLAVQQYGSDLADYYWEIYHLMGDPSLMPYVGLPGTITNNVPDTIALGSSSLQIQTDAYAFVGLSHNGVLIGASQADENGLASISFISQLNQPGFLKVVINNQFSKPIIDSIVVASPNYPLINISNIKYTNNLSQEVTLLNNNEEYYVSFTLANLGSVSIDSVKLSMFNSNNIIFLDSVEYIGSMIAFSNHEIQNRFRIKVIDGIEDKSILGFYFKIEGENSYLSNRVFSAKASCPNIVVDNLSITIDTANSSLVGEEILIRFDVKNTGNNISHAGSVSLDNISSNLSYISNNILPLNSLTPNAYYSYEFRLNFNSDNQQDNLIGFRMRAIANLYGDAKLYDSISMMGNIETFETGNLNSYSWENISTNPWAIDNNPSNSYQGSYSLKSGSILNNSKTTLNVNFSSIVNDSIIFFMRTSTEQNYDILRFYIDNIAVLETSGEIPWKRYAFAVSQGEHNFKWEYEKDYSLSGGSDAVWIDNVKFPINGIMLYNSDISNNIVNIIVYPNPAQDFISITNIDKNSLIKLFDSMGRLVVLSKNNDNVINTSNLNSGIYYLSIEKDNNIISKKIIITK